jgi:hypothetical protein
MRYSLMLLLLFALACKQKPTGLDKMPLMGSLDSVEVLYFKEPGNDRFFTYYPTTDKKLVTSLVQDISVIPMEGKQCSKEGKIYCFSKGSVFNTIYFSTNQDCRQLRFIVNGNLYQFPMSEKTYRMLTEIKSRAK